MSSESDMELVKKHAEGLGDHFDSVQIFVTRHEPAQEGGTVNINYGSGNYFTRYGHIADWMIRQDERSRKRVREEQEED